jgi:hypothetical protein
MSADVIYNRELCDERHNHMETQIDLLFKKYDGLDKQLRAIIMLLVANLAGILVSLVR